MEMSASVFQDVAAFSYQEELRRNIIIGSDEVGWGAVAGSLYVVGVAMPVSWRFKGLRDSKKLTRARREAIFDALADEVRGYWELAIFTPEQIDQLGPQTCLVAAHTSVLQRLLQRVPKTASIDKVIVDGNLKLPEVKSAVSIPKADDHFPVVSAASVLAKVLHDTAMTAAAITYPQYGFQTNTGYGTPRHLKAIKKHGMCPLHRRSYLKELLEAP